MHLHDYLVDTLDFSMRLSPNLFLPPKDSSQILSYSLLDGHHRLRVWLSQPTKEQVQRLLTSSFEMAMVIQKEFLVLLCRFDKHPWMMAPFQWHRIPAIQRHRPDLWNEAQFDIDLLDAASDQLWATRTVQCGMEFTASLCGAMLMQASTPWHGEAVYEQALQAFQKKYATPEKLLPLSTARMLVLE